MSNYFMFVDTQTDYVYTITDDLCRLPWLNTVGQATVKMLCSVPVMGANDFQVLNGVVTAAFSICCGKT